MNVNRSTVSTSMLLSSLALVLLILAGCTTTPPSAKDPRVRLLDTRVQRELAVYAATEQFTQDPTGTAEAAPLKVTVPVENLSGRRMLRLQYRFTFLDANGIPMDPQMSWQRIDIAPNDRRYIQGAAVSTGANDWELSIRLTRG